MRKVLKAGGCVSSSKSVPANSSSSASMAAAAKPAGADDDEEWATVSCQGLRSAVPHDGVLVLVSACQFA
jgi:hypothetical protein